MKMLFDFDLLMETKLCKNRGRAPAENSAAAAPAHNLRGVNCSFANLSVFFFN